MAFKIFALLLLVPVIHANIQVHIVAADDLSDSSIRVTGSIVDLISDTERNTFDLSDKNLKNAVNAYFGKRPDDVFVRSPTPWDDLYNRYGWQQVTRIIAPQRSTIMSLNSKSSLLTSQKLHNNLSMPFTYTVKMHKPVSNTINTTWNNSGEITVGQEIEYGMDIKVLPDFDKTSFKYSSKWGESVSKSETVTVGSEDGMSFVIEPYQTIIAELYATRGSMTVQIEYEASLTGLTAVNYGKSIYQGHHFWGFPINSVMSAGNLPRTKKSIETINCVYYTQSSVFIKDSNTNKVLYSEVYSQ